MLFSLKIKTKHIVLCISLTLDDHDRNLYNLYVKYIGLQPYHVKTPVPVWSLKLNNVEPGQHLDGWIVWENSLGIPGAAS